MCPCCNAHAYLKPLCLLFAVTNRGFIFSPQEATAQWALQARLAAVKAFYGAGGDQQRAVAAFDSSWNAQYRETDAMHIRGVRQFISYNVHKLESTYTLLTQPSPGRPHLIPDEEVRRAAECVFGRLKRELVVALYKMGWQNVTPEKVIAAVLSLLDNTRDRVCTPDLLQEDLKNLVNCYKVVQASCETGVWINDQFWHGTA